jgi:hypothetical protein
MKKLISPRGTSYCRVCNSSDLELVLDLGQQPLPSEYGNTNLQIIEAFPLELRVCRRCGLGQLGEYVLPERIFHDAYPYLSSVSKTWVEHAKKYALLMINSLNLDSNSLVLEIASNDGYLLSAFQKFGIPVLGIEPAKNVASIANNLGVPTRIEFFGNSSAENILTSVGSPRLIVANNVFAHIPDMHDFMSGISKLADDKTVITIENPSLTLLLERTYFDTIYHEHYSYLTAHSVDAVAKVHGLRLFHVDQLTTHGGSNRYWLSKSMPVDESVESILAAEISAGLFDFSVWASFAGRVQASIDGLRSWFNQRKMAGDIVVGYGAAHKGNTFLNSVGPLSKNLAYVVDASLEKQGKFLPGSQVPVLHPDQLGLQDPSDVLILPWNIASEIAIEITRRTPKARIWIAQPTLRQIN